MDDEDEDAFFARMDEETAKVDRLMEERTFLCAGCGEPVIAGEPVHYMWEPDFQNPKVAHAFCGFPWRPEEWEER